MNFQMFPVDIINEISKHSDNKSIASFLAINKENWQRRMVVYFYEDYNLVEDKNWFVPRLRHVRTHSLHYIPKVNSITHLSLGNFFNGSIAGRIPNTVTHLEFGYCFVRPITKGDIPDSVTHLTFGHFFDQPIKGIPRKVSHLTFGFHFNQPIVKGDLPASLEHLKFGNMFNKPLTNGAIPNSVTHLTFGNMFNQPIAKGDIPDSVKCLKFGNLFNQPISPGVIPDSVVCLEFGENFDQPISEAVIPESVTHLTLSTFFKDKLGKDFLNNVKHISFISGHIDTGNYNEFIMPNILRIESEFPRFPPSL